MIFRAMTSEVGIDQVYDDLRILMQKIADLRLQEGKHDLHQLKTRSSLDKLRHVIDSRRVIDRVDHNEEIKLFLKEVKFFQDLINLQTVLKTGNTDEIIEEHPDHDINPNSKIIVPSMIKTFMHKNVDFQLFVELLSDCLDQQRVFIDIETFQKLNFCKWGIPQLYISMCIKLSGWNPNEFLFQKLLQLKPDL